MVFEFFFLLIAWRCNRRIESNKRHPIEGLQQPHTWKTVPILQDTVKSVVFEMFPRLKVSYREMKVHLLEQHKESVSKPNNHYVTFKFNLVAMESSGIFTSFHKTNLKENLW